MSREVPFLFSEPARDGETLAAPAAGSPKHSAVYRPVRRGCLQLHRSQQSMSDALDDCFATLQRVGCAYHALSVEDVLKLGSFRALLASVSSDIVWAAQNRDWSTCVMS